MQLQKILIYLLFLYFFSLFVYSCDKSETQNIDIVADIDGISTISFSELNKYYHDLLFHLRYPDDKLIGYEAALNEMILRSQKEIDFIKTDMHLDPEITKSIQRNINEELIVEYFNREYLSTYINEDSIQDYYENMGREVSYRQIVINKPENEVQSELESLRQKVSLISDEISTGSEFSELVKTHSHHEESAQRDGYMPSITWRNSSSSALIRAIFRMNEGTVRALESSNAFYIIKVEEVSDLEVAPLEDVREEIIFNLRQLYLDQSLIEYEKVKNEVLNSSTLTWNEEGLNKLVKWAEQPNFYGGYYRETMENSISEGNNFVILSYSNGEIDLEEYLRLLNEILIPGKTSGLTIEEHKTFIEELVRSSLMVEKAREYVSEQDILTINTPSSALRNQFIRLYNDKKINSQIPESTEENLLSFYDTQKDSSLYQLAKVNLYARIFSDKDSANDLWTEIQNGKSFEEATNRRYRVQTFIRNRDGNIESFLSQQEPYLGEAAFALNEGETYGPVEYIDSEEGIQYAVIKSSNKLPEKQLDFSEVRDIEKKFRDFHRERLQLKIKNELKEKYPATIYREILEQKAADRRSS